MSQATLGEFEPRDTETGTETTDAPDALDDLPETTREDYRAVRIDGVRVSDRADERGVAVATVSRNVSKAEAQLGQEAER